MANSRSSNGGQRKRGPGGRPGLVRALLIVLTFCFAFGIGAAYASWSLVCNAGRCPSVDVLDEYTPRQTSKLFAADGRFLGELGLERRTLVRIQDIPPVVKEAFVATEDKRFFSHTGIDWIRVPGTILANLRRGGAAQGFSTITMQLAGNIFPERINRRERSGLAGITRKLKEAKVARAIEQKYSKDKILELYLNQIYLGNGAYGVETAAQRYFGKSVRELNVAEAATLAALPKGPTRYDPRRYPDRAVQRRNTVIGLMRAQGKIGDADASLARAYPLKLANKVAAGETAPYFVEWVRQELDRQFGKSLYEQGLRVYTTLDIELQDAAERALEGQMRAIENGKYGRYKRTTLEGYAAKEEETGDRTNANTPYLQGAFVAMDPRTGAVRALVGGRDFGDSKFNRATQALRQAGSTFKPVVYSAAIQQGRSPAYILDDSPLTVPMSGGADWTPQNYDGQFVGRIPMRRALYESRNIPAIRMGMELGERQVVDMARKFGLTSPIPAYPSIHIGAADVYPIEMIAAYSAFATLGTRTKPTPILRVENAKGEVLWAPEPMRVPVLSPEEAYLMVSMMKDVVRRGSAAGAVAGAGFNIPAGGKTGTTNDGTNVWFIGYTSDLLAGVWMGLDKPATIMANAQGGRLAAPAWTNFMKQVYRRRPTPPDWPQPAGIVTREVDAATGLLAGPGCGASYAELFIAGTEPVQACVPSAYGTPYDSTYPGGTPPTQPYPVDTSYRTPSYPPPGQTAPPVGGVPIGGSARPVRPARPAPTPTPDTTRIPRDTGLFGIPPRPTRDTTRRPPPLPQGTSQRDTMRPPPPDSLFEIRPQGRRAKP